MPVRGWASACCQIPHRPTTARSGCSPLHPLLSPRMSHLRTFRGAQFQSAVPSAVYSPAPPEPSASVRWYSSAPGQEGVPSSPAILYPRSFVPSPEYYR